MESLAPYRARIDALDDELIKLLRRRFDVVEEVALIKAREGIAAALPDRIEKVREGAAEKAIALGLDGDLVRDLYTRLIAHGCLVEERIMASLDKDRDASGG